MSFDPGWYGLPGTTFMYLLYPFYLVIFLVNAPVKTLVGLVDFNVYRDFLNNTWSVYVPNRYDTYLIARLVNSVVSVGVIFLTFVIAKKLFKNSNVALLSGIFLSLSPLFLGFGTYARTDILTMFFILLSGIVLYDAVETKSKRKLILTSILAGIAVATRFHGAMATLPIGIFAIITDYLGYKKRTLWEYIRDSIYIRTYVATSIVFGFLGFFLANPFTLLNWKIAIWHIKFEARGTHAGHERLPGLQNYLWYVSNVLIKGVGSISIFLTFLVGVFAIVKANINNRKFNPESKFVIPLLFPIIFYVFISESRLRWSRWMLPVLPYEVMLSAYGIYFVATKILQKIKLNDALKFWIIGVIIFVVPLYNAVNDALAKYKKRMSNKITEWAKSNTEKSDKIAIEYISDREFKEIKKLREITYLDVDKSRVFLNENVLKDSRYIFVVQDASMSLYCYPLPVFGSKKKGDELCDKDKLKDSLKTEILQQRGYKLIEILENKNYNGLSMEVYEKEK